MERRQKKFGKTHKEFDELLDIMSEKNNYSTYREHIKNANPPCLPLLIAYLNDLECIEDNLKNFFTENNRDFVNIEKYIRIGEIVSQIELYKQTKYNFRKQDIIYDFFAKGLFFLDEDHLYNKSREIEPVESPTGSTGKKKSNPNKRFTLFDKIKGKKNNL